MQVRNEVKELRLLFEVLQILDSASDLSDNLETVLEVMAEHTGMMRGVITLPVSYTHLTLPTNREV